MCDLHLYVIQVESCEGHALTEIRLNLLVCYQQVWLWGAGKCVGWWNKREVSWETLKLLSWLVGVRFVFYQVIFRTEPSS